MTTFSASLKKLTDLLPQSRDSGYYVSTLILAPLQLSVQKHVDITRTRRHAFSQHMTSA